MNRIYCFLSLILPFALLLGGCVREETAEAPPAEETVALTVWGAGEDEALLQEIFESFEAQYPDTDFAFSFEPQSESGCKDALLGDLMNGADVFTFADDQLSALAAAGALEPIENADAIRSANLSSTIDAASVDGTLYAYPLTADNGYFLYYNKEYISDEDAASLERILEVAEDAGLDFAMDWSSAWYVYSFFGNTGLTVGLNDDGITNYCTWNSTENAIQGVDVARAMVEIADSPGFRSCTDEAFLAGVRDGSVLAGVSGAWNALAIEEVWGEHMGASKLPTYLCAGQPLQMASFSGCKLVGANAYSEQPEWAARLAEWITSEKNQRLRFELRGQGPSNTQAAASEEVQSSPAIAALLAQSEFSQLQRVGGNFWQPVTDFTAAMLDGDTDDLQEKLDTLVEGISAR